MICGSASGSCASTAQAALRASASFNPSVCCMRPRRSARKTIRIANQNIVFALGVKFLVLILGALGYANMWAAVFADVGVSIIAILNAIRAMRVKLPDMPAGSTNQG